MSAEWLAMSALIYHLHYGCQCTGGVKEDEVSVGLC